MRSWFQAAIGYNHHGFYFVFSVLRFLLRYHYNSIRAKAIIALALTVCIAPNVFTSNLLAQSNHGGPNVLQASTVNPNDETIEELINTRINQEWEAQGEHFKPEIVRTEADYARLSATSRDPLYESSFHLQPHYYSHSATGPDSSQRALAQEPIMYYIGTARTPLALPMVSNLSKALSGNEASYTINIGVLPLPDPKNIDSMRYYVIIERTIESNHTDQSLPIERFHKEFKAKTGEPVFLRLADEPLAKGEYILQLESGAVLDFYDDFSRFIEEHIILKSDPLHFNLGHETVSDVSERLSIPYSVAQTCEAKVQLLSVVDTSSARTIVDTVREPADYLAELDMSSFADGPYQYRFTAIDRQTGKTLYTETHSFQKSEPITVNESSRIGVSDTLRVGGKKTDWLALFSDLHNKWDSEQVVNEQMRSTLDLAKNNEHKLELILNANKKNSIADVHGRIGMGAGIAAGENIFIGIESNRPALSFDASFGWMYAPPYLNYTPRGNASNIFKSPNSLGFQLQWIPVKLDKWFEPLIALAYYGTWSNITAGPNAGTTSAPLIDAQLGIAFEPFGELNGLGFSIAYGAAFDPGISSASASDLSFKAYVRF